MELTFDIAPEGLPRHIPRKQPPLDASGRLLLMGQKVDVARMIPVRISVGGVWVLATGGDRTLGRSWFVWVVVERHLRGPRRVPILHAEAGTGDGRPPAKRGGYIVRGLFT